MKDPDSGSSRGIGLRAPASLRGKAGRLSLFVALAVLASLFWRIHLLPERGTDALIYHLTLPASWLGRSCLAPVDLPFHDGVAQHSPMLSQTVTWLVMLIAGDGNLAWLLQPVFLLLILAAFFRSSRLAGLPSGPAAGLTALMATFRPFVNSSQMPNNELVMTAGFALAALGVLAARRRPGPALAVGTAGVGLMLGTKVVGIIYAAAALPLLAAAVALSVRRRQRPGIRAVLPWAAAAAGLLLIGSSFLLRNWIVHGNPLHPARLSVAGLRIFDGLYDFSALSAGAPSAGTLRSLLFDSPHQFGPRWRLTAVLWAGLIVNLAALALPRGRHRGRWPVLAVGTLFPIAAAAIFFTVVPFRDQHRLFFPVYYGLFLGLAGALAFVGRLKWRAAPHVAGWTPPALVALNLMAMHAWLTPGATGGAAVTACLSLAGRPSPRLRRRLKPVVAGLLACVVLCSPLWYPRYRSAREAVRRHVFSRGLNYGGEEQCWADLDRLGAKEGPLTVAYVGTPHVYPLFGPRLRNHPVYVPTGPDDRPRPVALLPGKGIPAQIDARRRTGLDEQFWIEGMKRAGVDYLLIIDDPDLGGVARELDAVNRHPKQFQIVSTHHRAYLVRVAKD